jgi:hypothetical protein
LTPHPDGTWRLLDTPEAEPSNWIYVFDVAERPGLDGQATPVEVKLAIGTDAATLGRAALQTAPTKAVDLGVHQDVLRTIGERLKELLPNAVRD